MSTNQPDGYLALPSSGKGRPVLVLHAWWGLNDAIKTLCERLAEAGFVAFAVDLYHGKVTDQIAEAGILGSALDENVDQARDDLADAVTFLKEHAGSDNSEGMAVIGFSLGAFYALDLSANDPENIRSVVVFYGAGPADFSKSKADYLGHFAENDEYEPKSNMDALEDALTRAGRPVTFYYYSGAGHWFYETDSTHENEQEAASLAWDLTLALLRR
jgi:carboxymethylenebutenolidase